jgi:Ca2+-binding EF-hand superfamily protein
MTMKTWMKGALAAGLGCAALTGGAWAQNVQPGQAAAHRDRPAGDLPGPIDSVQDLQDTAKMLFKLADTNNDDMISQKEAIDAGNLLVGGFFFRADQNGDGTLSQDEARQARDALLQQKPLLRLFVQRASNANAAAPNAPGPGGTNPNPIRALGSMLDGNNDRQIQASELRKAVQSTVQGIYDMADTNRDGQLTPAELNAAAIGAARSASQAAFQAADTDRNGQLSQAEFNKAIEQPADAVFRMMDANGDGQVSQQEAQSAQRFIASQLRMLRVPEPANSPRNVIESTRTPSQPPPPNFGGAAPPH